MPKAKGKNRRKKFNYNVNRKKLKRKSQKKPRIQCEQIRNAWDDTKSVARNLAEMGLAVDPNQTQSTRKGKMLQMDVDLKPGQSQLVRKPYVLKGLQEVASLPEKSSKGISSDMIEYVKHMIENHGLNYKAMSRDEKNYYQDTPKQIKRKIDMYQRYHPIECSALIASAQENKMDLQ